MKPENFSPVSNSPARTNTTILFSSQSASIYAVLRMLDKIRKEMGLEVALEWLERYISELEKSNRTIKKITDKVLAIVDANKIFNELTNNSSN